jgi:hypothetical protein
VTIAISGSMDHVLASKMEAILESLNVPSASLKKMMALQPQNTRPSKPQETKESPHQEKEQLLEQKSAFEIGLVSIFNN